MGKAWLGGALIGAMLIAAAPAGAAEDRPVLAADASQTGYVNVVTFGKGGTKVQVGERVGKAFEPLASGVVEPYGAWYKLQATEWRCDRLVRRFEARTVDPEGRHYTGRFSLRTPSCRHRMSIEAPREADPGLPFEVRLVDGWGIGAVPAQVCAQHERETPVCGKLDLSRGTAAVTQTLRLPQAGVWRLSVKLGRYVDRVAIGVGVPAPPQTERPVVLTTGDSTIQGIESYLEDRLPSRTRIARQYVVGSGISRPITPYWPYWPSLAQRQAQERAPRLTVISIGANDGWPLDVPAGKIDCCGDAWIGEYARRAGEMMDAYGRGGAGRVLWLTLPAPRQPARRRNSAAVNDALRLAAHGRPWVQLVQVDRIFTPGFRYRKAMRDHGRKVRVREPDGIHLTAAGTDIAARAVAYAVRHWPGTL